MLLDAVSCHYIQTLTGEIPIPFNFSWACCYMAQMNVLFGPKLHSGVVRIAARNWGDGIYDFPK